MTRLPAAVLALAALVASPAVRQISQSGFGAYEASLAPTGTGFVAAWYDTRHGHGEIYARVLDAVGAPAGPELRLTNGTNEAYEADVATSGDTMFVAWYEQGAAGYRAMVGAWSRDGVEQWRRQLSERPGKNTLVRVRGGEVFCAWLELLPGGDPVVRARWLHAATGAVAGDTIAVAPAGRTTWNLNAAIDVFGTAIVVFDATAGTRADEVFLSRVDRVKASTVRLTDDDGKRSKYPDLTLQGRLGSLTWQDEKDGSEEVYLLVTPLDELDGSIDRRGTRVTRTPGASIGAYNAWNGDRLGLAWCDDTIGQHEIYFQSFAANGRPDAPPHRMTDTPTQSLIPAIQPGGRGFALLWNEVTPGPGGGHNPRSKSEIMFALAPSALSEAR